MASAFFTLLFGVLGAQLLGAEIFGEYISIFTIAGLVSVATSVGLPALLQRELAASHGSGDRSGLKPLVQGLMIINGGLAAACIVALLAGSFTLGLILCFCLLGNVAGLLGSLFASKEKMLIAGWAGDVIRPCFALLGLFLLSRSTSPSELVPFLAQVIGLVAAISVLLILWRGEPLSNVKRAFAASWWSQKHPPMFRAGLTFAATQLLINLTTQVDILILTAMASPEDVAHYYAAVRAALVISFFFGASGLLAEPALTRLYAAKESDRLQSLARRTAINGALVTVVAAIFAVLIAPWYLGLFGPSFVVAFPSFCIFTAGIVVMSLFGPAQPMLRAIRAENRLLLITGGTLLLNIFISILLVPWLGIIGASIGSAVQFTVYGLLMAQAVCKHSGYRSDVFDFKRTALAKG